MRNRFDRQLEQLNNELIEMGNLIEQAIQMSVNALIRKDVINSGIPWLISGSIW